MIFLFFIFTSIKGTKIILLAHYLFFTEDIQLKSRYQIAAKDKNVLFMGLKLWMILLFFKYLQFQKF